jgi:hypothetical protein
LGKVSIFLNPLTPKLPTPAELNPIYTAMSVAQFPATKGTP